MLFHFQYPIHCYQKQHLPDYYETTEDNVSKRYFNPDAISNVTVALPGSNFSATGKLSTSGSWLNNIQAETPAITTTDAAAIQDNIPLLFTCFLFFSFT